MARKEKAREGGNGGIVIAPRDRITHVTARESFRVKLREMSKKTGHPMMDLLDLMIDQVKVPEVKA